MLEKIYEIRGIKTEFESEISTDEENFYLRKFAKDRNLNFVVKLGGLSSVNDIRKARFLGADSIVAPMVESKYALQKFVENAYGDFKLFINTETKTAVENIEEILSSPYISKLKGIIIGRNDLSLSLNIEANETLKIVQNLIKKIRKTNLEIGLGGCITPKSYDYLKSVDIDFFETRKVIFNSNILKDESKTRRAIFEALKFETDFLNNRQALSSSEQRRLKKLQEYVCLCDNNMKQRMR